MCAPRRLLGSVLPLLFVIVPFIGDAAPAAGQDGGRYRVLVAPLAPGQGADARFGEDVAKRVREALDDFPTHAPVTDRELRAGPKVDAARLSDCVIARQLAIQIDAELVLCGSYQQSGDRRDVTAKFVVPETGEEFAVPPFGASRADEAAGQILAAFQGYLDQLRLAVACHEALGRETWAEAVDRCGAVVTANPGSPSAHYNVGSAFMKLDRNDEALAAFEQAIAIDASFQDALLAAGLVASKTGATEKARGFLREYLALNPGDMAVRLNIAVELAQAGDPQGALALLEEGYDAATADATTNQYAGHFALAAARQAMEKLDPDAARDPAASALLEKTLQYYDRALTQQPDSADATMRANVIIANRLLGRTQEALAAAEQATRALPDNAGIWSAYADVLAEANRTDEAIRALDRVRTIDPSYAVNARLGAWALKAGNVNAAQASFRTAVRNGEVENGDQIARMIFGQGYNTHHKNGRYDTAITHYNIAREFANAATTGMINFFHGYALFQKAMAAQKPSTAASARASLPLFQEARSWLLKAEAYREQQTQRLRLLENIAQYIAIQEALIKRG